MDTNDTRYYCGEPKKIKTVDDLNRQINFLLTLVEERDKEIALLKSQKNTLVRNYIDLEF
jgi:hypothetical protein